MYRIVICDDEPQILSGLEKMISYEFGTAGISADYVTVSDSRRLMEQLMEESIDILFLDIDMPYYSGMDIAGFLNENDRNTILIFVTSHDALVYRTFAYKPFAFLRKTHLSEDLKEVSGRIAGELDRRRQKLLLCKGSEVHKLKINDIVYIESDGNYVEIVTQTGRIRYRETMTEMEEELSAKGFLRCHKGYLVNPEYIVRFKSGGLEMGCGGERIVEIPVSRSYEKEVRRKIVESVRR